MIDAFATCEACGIILAEYGCPNCKGETMTTKTFADLKFSPHQAGIGGTQAEMAFDNGYGVSVIFGDRFYSNGVDTYELAVLENGRITYDTPITDDVLGYLTEAEVTETMEAVQSLNAKSSEAANA